MRQPARAVCISTAGARARALSVLVIVAAICLAGGHARADDRSDARAHYQAGVKYYGSGDYQGAVREFSAAQQLVPADLNNYNLALCYDKLGDAEPAIQYYRAFLDRQPGTDKRAEVEASIARLEAAQRSAAGKRAQADGAKRADDAVAAPPPPSLPPTGSAGAGVLPSPGAPPAGIGSPGAPSASAAPRDDRRRPGPAVAGSLGTPGSASPAPTGDPQLDRANAINIDEIRDQRAGVLGGPAGRRAPGPAVAAADGSSPGGSPQPAPGEPALASNPQGGPQPGRPDEPKPEAPLYKKWWFWAVAGVTAYVAYELVTSDSSSSSVRGRTQPQSALSMPRSGLTLLSW